MDLCCVARLHETSSITVSGQRIPTDILPRTPTIFRPAYPGVRAKDGDGARIFLELRGPGRRSLSHPPAKARIGLLREVSVMANEWFYSKSGKRFGPVSGQQLKELAAKGGIGPDDLVWKEGMAQWLPAKSITGLFEVASNAIQVQPATKPSSPNQPVESQAGGLMAALQGSLVARWNSFTPRQKVVLVAGSSAACLLLVLLFAFMIRSPSDSVPGQTKKDKRADVARNDPKLESKDFAPKSSPFMEKAKKQDEEEEKLIQKADELWTSGKKHDAADIYQGILDKHGGLYHGKAASSRVYSRTIDSLVERGGPGAVQNYIRMATIARVSLVLSNPEARKLAGDAAAKEQEFLTTPPDTGSGEVGGLASADQIARRTNAIASDLKSLTSEKDMRSNYGPPTAFHQSSIKKNAYLIAWERTRQSGQKDFLAITFLRRLDGQDQVIIVNADVVPSLDRLKEMLNSKAVWNP